MNCYLNLLGITQRSSAAASITSTDLTPGAKLLILKSLRTFLSHALPSTTCDELEHNDEQSCPTWFFRSAFASSAEFEYFQRLIGRHASSAQSRRVSIVSVSADGGPDAVASASVEASYSEFPSAEWGRSSLMDLSFTSGKSLQHADLFNSLQTSIALQPVHLQGPGPQPSKSSPTAALSLYGLLDPVLLASFLDTAPSAFQPDLSISQQSSGQNVGLSTPAQLVFEIISLTLAMWRGAASPSSQAKTSLANMLGHVSIYFPFSQHTSSAALSAKAKSLVVQMDLAYAELAALVALNDAKSQKIKSKFNVEAQIASVSTFIADLLSVPVTESGTVALGSTGGSAASVLDSETFRALLPTLWFLLRTDHETLLDSLLSTYHAQARQYRVKAVLFEFLARAYLLSKLRAQTPFSGPESDRILESLLSTLPRNLWEAASTSSGHAYAALQLEFLHFLLLLPTPPTALAYEKLGPFYWLRHPTKKVSGPGPFKKLPRDIQRLALDLGSFLRTRDDKLDKAISSATQDAHASTRARAVHA